MAGSRVHGSGRGAAAGVLLAGVLLAGSAPASGQSPATDPRLSIPVREARPAVAPGVALLASALGPGTGQYLLGAGRWVPYAVLEVWAWVAYLEKRGDARTHTRRYRDLAWSVARRVSVGERRDTVFDYYETMSKFAASGLYDADPKRDGVQPETDPSTFNGDLWLLARSLFFPGGFSFPEGSPQYIQAMRYYLRHAIPSSYAWAWGDSDLVQDVFAGLIRSSDAAARAGTQLLGVILANHLVSAVDALVLARVQRERAGGLSARLGSGADWQDGPRWTVSVRVAW
jgi:hypothetical protein